MSMKVQPNELKDDGENEARQPTSSSSEPGSSEMNISHDKEVRDAFDMIDKDNSGTITAHELGVVLRIGGTKIKDKEVKKVMKLLDPDNDGSINFEEFKQIVGSGGTADQFLDSFREKAVLFHNQALEEAATPLFERIGMRGDSKDPVANARFRIAQVLDGSTTQMVLLALIVFDVMFVVMELLVSGMKCPCKGKYSEEDDESDESDESDDGDDSGRRLLVKAARHTVQFLFTPTDFWRDSSSAGAGFTPLPAYDELGVASRRLQNPFAREEEDECESESAKYHTKSQDDVEYALHCMSLSILLVFAVQILMLMFAYGRVFFKTPAYLLDTVVVGVALLLDAHLDVPIARLGVVVLFWRVLRVIHGLYITYEHHHNNFKTKEDGEREKHSEHVPVKHEEAGEQ